jgi:activator of 2-hydroxyglutaryl-CoA dehydratase
MCTVFAESEVVSPIGRGEDSRRVALGIHAAIPRRLAGMVRRTGSQPRFVFAGGGAHNLCLYQALLRELETDLTVPPNPQTVGALGAALFAERALG